MNQIQTFLEFYSKKKKKICFQERGKQSLKEKLGRSGGGRSLKKSRELKGSETREREVIRVSMKQASCAARQLTQRQAEFTAGLRGGNTGGRPCALQSVSPHGPGLSL